MISVLAASGFDFDCMELLISVIAICFTILEAIRAFKGDVRNDTSNMTAVIVKLENIQETVSEIKSNIGSIEQENVRMGQRLSTVEESVASLWNYTKELKGEVRDLTTHERSENHDDNPHV